ncbi:hypothetical protein ACEWY4_008175 [Coilia grayii]|uniref:Uncharacterized protein n=1 Tax=Coilia grayii TaxID=363190 RepID=A0ABD1KA53_9TELE
MSHQEEEEKDMYIQTRNYSLGIPSLEVKHTGRYECKPDFVEWEYLPDEVFVCSDLEATTVLFSEGDAAALVCGVELNVTTAMCTFYRHVGPEQEHLTLNPEQMKAIKDESMRRGRMSRSQFSLTMSNLTFNDSGVYYCRMWGVAEEGTLFCFDRKIYLLHKHPFGIHSTFYRVYSALMACALLGMICAVLSVNLKIRGKDQACQDTLRKTPELPGRPIREREPSGGLVQTQQKRVGLEGLHFPYPYLYPLEHQKTDPMCLAGTFGPNCTQVCQCSTLRHQCHHTTGRCTCPPGYYGNRCDISVDVDVPMEDTVTLRQGVVSACLDSWEPIAALCGEGGQCHPVTGGCHCAPGRTGQSCQQVCPRGRYGAQCRGVCACLNGGVCDAVEGSCQCGLGWTGPRCETGQYGPGCALECLCQNNGTCDRFTGCCDCSSGYYGNACQHRLWSQCPSLAQQEITRVLIKQGVGGKQT